MKRNFHLCLSSENEIIFRDTEDYNRGFNYFAVALYKTSSVGLVESFMSTHCHLLVQTEDPDSLMYHFRNSYSKYFNFKYKRNGKLGEDKHFFMEVIGYNHLLAAMSYILRNPLHHGVAPIPFAYPYSTANSVFRKEMGKFFNEPLLSNRRSYTKYVGRNADYPDSYKMTASGVFLRESVLDIPQVENIFVSPRAYSYYMTRKSSEEWNNEQNKDGNGVPPINLLNIESGVKVDTYDKMLKYENGKENYRSITDIELCSELDAMVRERYSGKSIYELSDNEKIKIAEHYFRTKFISRERLKRCLAL